MIFSDEGVKRFEKGVFGRDCAVSSAVSPDFPDQRQISDVRSLCRSQQNPSGHVQIDQPTGHKQPVGVLVQPSVTNLAEAEDPLENQKWMLDLRPYLRLGPAYACS